MENEKEYWAKIINDARLYNGTPHMLTELTEHFMKHYKVALRQPPVIKSVCDHSEVYGKKDMWICCKCDEIVQG